MSATPTRASWLPIAAIGLPAAAGVAFSLSASCYGFGSATFVAPDGGGAAGSTTTGQGGGGAPPCPEPWAPDDVYYPETACWTPVRWPNTCNVEYARLPERAAPPLVWDPCEDGTPGCEELRVPDMFDDDSLYSKASVLPWKGGYRIGLVHDEKLGGGLVAVYDSDASPIAAWRVKAWADCVMPRPILTKERVWLGATHIDHEGFAYTDYVAPRWNELTTVDTPIQMNIYVQSWYATSDLGIGWSTNGSTMQIEDLLSGTSSFWGGIGGQGNPEYAWPHAVGDSIVALSAPDGFPDLMVWDRATESFATLVNPPAPSRVADVNSDGETLAWIVVPKWSAPGELWTSPMATTASELVPTKRRATPAVGPKSSAAYAGYYAVYSPDEQFGGDNSIHVYRLADAHHWSYWVPTEFIKASFIYHVDATYLFYSGHGALVRQRMDVAGMGDPAP